jgi:Putative prokaryotic signal transducing protein
MQLKLLATYDNYLLANMTKGLLEENEIFCSLKDENTILSDPLLSNAIGGIKLLVPEQMYSKAKEIIKTAEMNFVAEKHCKNCKTKSLTIEEKTDEPTTFFGKLKNNILYGQTNLYSKKYRCTNCNYLQEVY